MLGTKPNGSMSVFERTLERCMGMAVNKKSLYVSTLYQIWRFENIFDDGVQEGEFDACYSPQMSYVTGDIDVHDMALDNDGELTFINTLFGCVAKPSLTESFTPVWRPPFLSKLAAEDRCHLNGMAVDANGSPAYVTAVSQGDVADSWRDDRVNGGVVIDVVKDEVIADGFSMPHSPRIKHGGYNDGALYVLNSGTGEFGIVDPNSGDFTAITFCPGYARGLCFVGDYAVVGLSLPRDNKTFQGLPLDAALAEKNTEPRCGLLVIDLKTGDIVHWLRITGIVSELYDVAFMPGVRNPSLIGFQSDEIRRVLKVGK